MSSDKKRRLLEGWKWEKLEKITTNIQYGISKSSTSNEVGPRLLRITDIQEGKVDWNRVPFCECNSNEEKQYLLENNDIVFVRTGATTGKNFLLNNPENTLFASYLIRVQCNKELVNPKYLYTFFQTPEYWNNINQKSRGGTLAGFNASMLSNMEIPLPPTPADQLAIASDIEHRMAHVEKMRAAALRQKEAIAAMQGAILREVFSYKEGDELPEGWKLRPLKENCFINPSKRKGFTREPNAQTSFVPMEAVDEETGKIAHIIKRNYFEISKGYTFFEEGDVLFAKITPCMQNGKSAIAHDLIDGVGFGSTEFHILRPKKDITKEWIYFYVRTVEFRKRAKDHFEGSAGQQRVSTNFIENSLIPLPPALSDQIAIVTELDHKMAELEKARQAAERQLEAIKMLPGAILREVFDFEEENTDS